MAFPEEEQQIFSSEISVLKKVSERGERKKRLDEHIDRVEMTN